ncbi:MAG: N-acetylmuramoyl-L-alanine amidase [Solirubrobacterales bacterium]
MAPDVFEEKMRRKLIGALALALAGLSAWVAAPALSLQPYLQGAEDFERALPAAKRLPPDRARAALRAHGGEGPAARAPRWISPPVRAQHPFDLVGVAREMRTVEIRAREEGGEWSEWVEQAEGTPVFVDGADEAQVRSPFRPRGELHFVNVSGTAGGTAERLLGSAREAINSAFIAVASTPVAQALSPKPKVVKRASWGADLADGGCAPRGPAEYGTVGAAVIHHTVNANDYPPEEAAAIVLGICRFHVLGNGWNDIGYNALVDRYGRLYEGRAGGLKQPVVGAQAQGFNAQTTSIASLGEHSSEGITKKARASIIRYLAWKLGVSRASPATGATTLTSAGGAQSRYPEGAPVTAPRILGHGDLGLTECPGALLAPQIPAIRTGVQKRIKRYAKPRGKRKGGKGKKRAP